MLDAMVADVGEIGEQEGPASLGRSQRFDFANVPRFKSENEISGIGNLRGESFRTESGGIDVCMGQKPGAVGIDGVLWKSPYPRAVGSDARISQELGKHQFGHRGTADVAGAYKQNPHIVVP